MYIVTNNPIDQIIKVKVTGFWTMAIMSDYSRELFHHAKLLQPSGGCKRVLVDMTDYPIQSQVVAQAHVDALGYAQTKMNARVAFVTRSSLSRLQTVRLAKRAGVTFFDDEAAALSWLASE